MHGALTNVLLQTSSETLTYTTPVGDLPVVDDARWSAGFTGNSWGAFVVWILLLIVLQAVMWPLVRRFFLRFPDRGWGFSRMLTLLVSGYAVWFLASVQLISFRAIWCAVAIVVVAAIAWAVGRWLGAGDQEADFARPWTNRTIIAAELVFWVVFGIFLAFRLANPDSWHPIWGGEKAMEFAQINAILRSAHFPPVDPWYAGGYINYYYYGEYLVAFLFKLTGIPTEIGFNLAQPTVMAFLASGGFSVAAAFGKFLFGPRRFAGIGTIGTGIVGVILLSFAGNLVEMARLVDAWLHGSPYVYGFSWWVWDPSRAVPSPTTQQAITEFPYFSGLYADLHAHVVALPITVIAIGIIFSLVIDWRAVAVATSIPRVVPRLTANLVLRLALLALVIGTLWPTNAWDVPMYVALSGVGMLMATRGITSLVRRLVTVAVAMASVGIVAYLLIQPFLNHYVALFSEVDARDANTPLVSVESHFGVFLLIIFAGFSYVLAKAGRLPTVIAQPLVPFGATLVILLFRWWAVGRDELIIRIADGLTVFVVIGVLAIGFSYAAPVRSDFRLAPELPRIMMLVGAGVSFGLLIVNRPVPALYLGIGIVAAALWLSLSDSTERFLAAMVAAGALLGAFLEYFFLVDDLAGGDWYRMNSVFKFYNEIWVLFSLASAGLIARMATGLPEEIGDVRVASAPTEDAAADAPARRAMPVRRPGWAFAGIATSAVLIIAALAYPLHATSFRLDQHFDQASDGLTLDAYDWMNYGQLQYRNEAGTETWMVGYKDDRAAIDWLNENVAGTPVIAEASFGTYRCNGSRFSINTGLPDVIGWQRHEQQQRYLTDLAERENVLREFYTTSDIARKQEIIQTYDIRYVIVGDTERYYPTISGNDCVATDVTAGIAAIESMVGTDLEVAFTSGTTTVYRVVTSAAN